MSVAPLAFRGVLAFPLTAFDAAGDLDVAATEDHVAAQVEAGAGALFVACGTGEFASLSVDEVHRVVRIAVRRAAGRVPVVAGAGGGHAVARDFALAARDAGADGVLLLPPYLVEAPSSGLVAHVRHVVRDLGLPTVVYRRANARYDVTAARQLLDVPEVVGLKDGVGDVDRVGEIVRAVRSSGHPRAANWLFFNGIPTAEVAVADYRLVGVSLYSSAVHCFAPDLAHAFWRATEDGDDVTTDLLLEQFYRPLVALRDEVPGYAVALVKAATVRAGWPVGGVRAPLVDPTPEHLDRLDDVIARGRRALAGGAA